MRTIICVGSGPSVDDDQIERMKDWSARGATIIAVNRAWELVPWCEMVYIADKNACLAWLPEIRKQKPCTPVWSVSGADDTIKVKGEDFDGLNMIPGHVNHGGSGGYQAVNLAYHLRADYILLVGYDYQHTDGKTHFHGDHPEGWANFGSPEERGKPFRHLARDLARHQIKVVNCSKQTSLPYFERGEL